MTRAAGRPAQEDTATVATEPAGPNPGDPPPGEGPSARPAGRADDADGHETRPPEAGPDLPSRVVLAATWLAVGLGAALRVRQWSSYRPYWLDELLLLRAMRAQRWGELLEPLDLAQSAPPGWLAVQHVVVGVGGDGERVARLVPLLFGIGALVVLALLARRLLGGPAAAAATAIAAVSPSLVKYSSEAKQYSADAFFVPLVLLLGCRLALDGGGTRRDRFALAAVAGVAVWFSHAAILVTIGVFAWLAVLALARRQARDLVRSGLCGLPWVAGVAAQYVLLRRTAGDELLHSTWVDTFPGPGPLTPRVAIDWLAARASDVARFPLYLDRIGVLVALAAAGLVVLGLRRLRAVPAVLVPVGVVVAAGLAGSYPIADRLALFLVPLVALVLAAPLDLPALAAHLPGRARVPTSVVAWLAAAAALAGLVALVGPQARITAAEFGHPRESEESRTVLEQVAAARRPGDLVLVDGRGSRFAAEFYGPRVGLGPFGMVRREEAPGGGCPPGSGSLGSRLREEGRHTRIWLFYSHVRSTDLRAYKAHLRDFGPVIDTIRAPGAMAILYERRDGAVPPPATSEPPPCVRLTDPATLP